MKRIKNHCALILFVSVALENVRAEAPPPATAVTAVHAAEVLEIAPDQSSIRVLEGGQHMPLGASSPEMKAALKSFQPGDRVDLEFNKYQDGKAGILRDLAVVRTAIGIGPRILAVGLAAGGLALLFEFLLGFRIRDLVIGTDNRYSKSKFQMAIWFYLVITCYVALTGLRLWSGGLDFIGGISIPKNLLLLSGLSTLGFAGAKAVTQGRVNAMLRDPNRPAARALQPGSTDAMTLHKIEGAEGGARPSFPYDLFHDDEGRVDLGDFQVVVITMLAVVVYALTVFNDLRTIPLHRLVTLPDVDSTVLAAFGLGQGAYLAKKSLGDVGGGNPSAPPNPQPTVVNP